MYRPGYYAYFSTYSIDRRGKNYIYDIEPKDNVLKVFDFKNKKKGARQIKMVLQSEVGINYDLKSIRRIM